MVPVHQQKRDDGQVAVERGEQVVAHTALRIDDGRVREAHLKTHQLAGELGGRHQRANRHAEREADRHFPRRHDHQTGR